MKRGLILRIRIGIVVLGMATAVGCMLPCRRPPDDAAVELNDEAFEDMALLTETLLLVRRHYVETRTFREVVHGAINGMLVALDPSSGFLPPESLDDLETETRGCFGGIGVSVGVENGNLRVIAPVEDSPAFKAGVHAGDRILAVDGRRMEGVSIDEAVKAIRGEPGTTVKLTLRRPDGEQLDVSVARADIRLAAVKKVQDLGEGIGYLRITHFNEPAAADFAQALSGLEGGSITDLIIDVRDNPGGLLEAAVGVAEQILPEGLEIVSVRGRDGGDPKERFLAGPVNRRETALPIVLLINEGSASASEALAGALQAHRRAVLVGARTYGKASVQNVIRLTLRPDYAVRLTTAYYHTPDGRLIHGKGIEPDVLVPVSRAEWRLAQRRRIYEEMLGATSGAMANLMQGVRDEQLERAIEVLKGARRSKQQD